MNLIDETRARQELERAIADGTAEEIAKAAMSNLWPLCSAHPELLLSTINDLPAKVLERFPVLRVFHPMTPVVARTAPYKPLGRPDDTRDRHPDELDATLLGQMIAARQSGNISAAQSYADRLESRLGQTTTDGRTRTGGPCGSCTSSSGRPGWWPVSLRGLFSSSRPHASSGGCACSRARSAPPWRVWHWPMQSGVPSMMPKRPLSMAGDFRNRAALPQQPCAQANAPQRRSSR